MSIITLMIAHFGGYVKKKRCTAKSLLHRQFDYKSGSAAKSGSDRNFAAVKAGKVFYDGEAEAGAANFAGAASVGTVKSLENTR